MTQIKGLCAQMNILWWWELLCSIESMRNLKSVQNGSKEKMWIIHVKFSNITVASVGST